MKTIDIHGQAYVPVHERVLEFYKRYPTGYIQTDLVSALKEQYKKGDTIVMRARVWPEAKDLSRVCSGYSQEEVGSSKVNTTSAFENAETSAVGRALGFLGIGIETGIASADEVTKAVRRAPAIDPKTGEILICTNCADELTQKVAEFSQGKFGKPLCYKCQKKISTPTVKIDPPAYPDAPLPDDPF